MHPGSACEDGHNTETEAVGKRASTHFIVVRISRTRQRNLEFLMGDSAYAFSLTTFSPTGKLGQIEHALQAVHKGKTCLGIQGMCRWVAQVFCTVRRRHSHAPARFQKFPCTGAS